MSHISLLCSVEISELIRVCVLVTNVLGGETRERAERQAQHGLGQTAERERERVRGGDSAPPALGSLFHPDDEDSLPGRAPRL